MRTLATREEETTTRRPMTGPKVWERATLDDASYMITVEPHQAEACLRIRADLRRRGKRIDFIFHSPHFEPATAGIDHTNRDGRYPSDHYPVKAVLKGK